MLLFTWQFWAFVHAAIAVTLAVVALARRCPWTATGAIVGGALGCFLAVVPLWMLMARSSERTGYDAGNAGVLFACTVPFVPPVAIAIGAALGFLLDARRDHDLS